MAAPANPHILFYAAALAAGALTTWLALPAWRQWCLRTGLIDHPGHRKIHQAPVPLAGGMAVLTGLILPLAGAALVLWLWPGGLADATSIVFVYRVCAYLPLIGLLTGFLPDLGKREPT